MATFHPEIPYIIAKKKGEIQLEIISRNCNGLNNIEQFDVNKTYNELIQAFHSENFE